MTNRPAQKPDLLPKSFTINSKRFADLLKAQGGWLPYTIATGAGFDLFRALKTIEIRKRTTVSEHNAGVQGDLVKVIPEELQIKHWLACVEGVSDGMGWTLCISGRNGHLGLGEPTAAYLAHLLARQNLDFAWCDIGEALRRKSFSVYDFAGNKGMAFSPKLAVVSGLRMDGHDARWERAADLLRSSTSSTNRVVVAHGDHPLAVMRRLGLPVQRVLNLGTVANSVDM